MPPNRLAASFKLALAALVAACTGARTDELPQLLAPSEDADDFIDPFIDLRFALSSRERSPTGAEQMIAVALDGSTEVGFSITLDSRWKSETMATIPVFLGVVTLGSLGARSHRFVQSLDRIYATGISAKSMAARVTFAAISLEGNPNALDSGLVGIKLFFESDDEGRYAEVYLNLDARNGTVSLNEKDPEYRAAIVRALSGS